MHPELPDVKNSLRNGARPRATTKSTTTEASSTISEVIKQLVEMLHARFSRGVNKVCARHADVDTRPPLQPLEQFLLRQTGRNRLSLSQQVVGHAQTLRCRAPFQLFVTVL
jgi:hypothetical protein